MVLGARYVSISEETLQFGADTASHHEALSLAPGISMHYVQLRCSRFGRFRILFPLGAQTIPARNSANASGGLVPAHISVDFGL